MLGFGAFGTSAAMEVEGARARHYDVGNLSRERSEFKLGVMFLFSRVVVGAWVIVLRDRG